MEIRHLQIAMHLINIFTTAAIFINLFVKAKPSPEKNACEYTSKDAENILHSIAQIISFYQDNYRKINISNGGVGLGILKGQFNYLLAKREEKLSPKLKVILQRFHSLSGQLALHILDQAVEASTNKLQNIGIQVIRNNTHIFQARFRDWHCSSLISNHFQEFTGIIGNQTKISHSNLDFHCHVLLVKSCSVPQVCRNMYLAEVQAGYMLIHQIMNQQFAERRSCVAVNKEAFEDSQEYQDRLCSKAYLEAEQIAKNDFPKTFLDLFAQQVGFCALMGYPNFLKGDWINAILQSISDSGCVTNSYRAEDDVVIYVNQNPCLVHQTSSTLMALALNFRYLMDSCSGNIFDGNFNY